MRRALQFVVLLLASTRLWSAIGIDANVSADGSGSTITSPAFSTLSPNQLLLAFIATDANSSGIRVSAVTGAGLNWALVQRTNAQLGTAEIWRAFAPSTLSRVTVNARLSQRVAASITILTFTGVDNSGTNGSGAIGATASANAGPGAPTATLITTRNYSWVFGVGTDWDRALARTVGPNQTLVHQFMPSVGHTYWVQRQNASTPFSGTSVSINDTAPTTDRYNLSIVEILPALSSGLTYSISGTIAGAGGSGATVALTGTSNATVTADVSGNYTFSGLASGSYTVTPSKAGFAFAPASQTVSVNNNSVTALNFTTATYSISGTIAGAGGSGATVVLTGTSNATVTADASGNYSFTGLANGTYTVTPSKTGFTFTPASTNATINGANQTANFTASPQTWTIQGTISGGSGATVNLSQGSTIITTVTADAGGNYTLSSVVNGTYTVTPSNAGYVFTPSSQTVTVSGANLTGINFTASQTWSIQGNISPSSSGTGAAVTLTQGATTIATATADSNGNYTLNGVVNGTYTVTPTKSGYTCTPLSQGVTVNGTSVTGINFTASALPTYGISGMISPSANGSGATVTLSGTASATTTADASGAFSFSGLANGSYTVTPTKTGFTISPASEPVSVNNASVTGVNFTAALGLGIDVVAYGDTNSASTTAVTSPFSTTGYSELLLAFIATDASSSGITVTGVTGGGLTWALAQRTNAQLGTAEVWSALAPSPLSNVSVTGTLSQRVASSISVVGFTGVDSSGTSGSGAIGARASASAGSDAPTASLVTTRNNSWVIGVGNDWDNAIARTVGPNQTLVHQFMPSVGDTYWVQRQSGPTSLSGTSVTMNDTAPTSDRYNLTIVEVLPAVVASGVTYGISGTLSPAAQGSGATVVLSGSASGTTMADSSGNYAFSGLANGSYTVTPSKSGYSFSPAAQSATINGTSVGNLNLTVSATSPPVVISIAPTSATVTTGGTQQFTATLQNTSNTAVTWQVNGVTGGNTTTGTISSSGLYTGPATVPNPATVTVTAISQADPSKSASALVTVVTQAPVNVTISPTSATVTTGGTQQFTATVQNTSNTAVTWLATGGTISAGGLYTAPGTAGTYSVTATSVADTSKSASATVTVTAAGSSPNLTVDGALTYQTMIGMGLNVNSWGWKNGELAPALDLLLNTAGTNFWKIYINESDWVAPETGTRPAATLTALANADATTLNTIYNSGTNLPGGAPIDDIFSIIGYLNSKGVPGSQISVNFQGWTAPWIGGHGGSESGGYTTQSYISPEPQADLDFATMVASLVYYGKAVKGLSFDWVAPDNEPDTSLNGFSASAAQIATIDADIYNALQTIGGGVSAVQSTRGLGPEAGSNCSDTTSYATAIADNSSANTWVQYFDAHSYPPNYTGCSNVPTGYSKPWFFSETSHGCTGCDTNSPPPEGEWAFSTETSDLILTDLIAGWTGFNIWNAYDGWNYTGTYDAWGMLSCTQNGSGCTTNDSSGTRTYAMRKRAYAYAIFGYGVQPGMVRVSLTSPSGVTAVGFKTAAGIVSIAGHNTNGSTTTLIGSITNISPLPTVLKHYETDSGSNNFTAQADVTVTAGSFSVSIPADTLFLLQSPAIAPAGISYSGVSIGRNVSSQ